MKKILASALFTMLVLTASMALSQPVFDHVIHRDDAELDCAACHSATAGGLPHVALMPKGESCLDCHDDDILASLPERPFSHQGEYRNGHQFDVIAASNDCALCHSESESCTQCHHGENVEFLAHQRNWYYEHAITVNRGTEDCAACHDTRSYCTDCHVGVGVKPADHLVPTWIVPVEGGYHASEGRADLGSCILCHDGLEPTLCVGCHPGMGE